MVDEICSAEAVYNSMMKEHKHLRTLRNVHIIPDDVKDALKGEYAPVSNKQTVELAKQD